MGNSSIAAWLQRWWQRVRGPVDASGRRLRRPSVRRYGRYAALQFTRSQTQSRMLADDPDHLLIDYTRTMLAALLWAPARPRIGMVGLGGGSQVKFIHRHFPEATLEVVENNPWVVGLRREFGIPDDDARLRVEVDDGAAFVAARPGRYDVLLVDGYDETGIPPVLSTQRFYADCHAALAPGGALSVNLFVAEADVHVERLHAVFGAERVLVVEESRMRNQIAFAWRGPLPGPDRAAGLMANREPAAIAQLQPVLDRVAAALAAHPGTETPG
ncbi:transferase [Luteimonas sp. MHLX1A]|uniref:spermine/spermidine synthase domain-containing protein n=1 Tax=Alterluteimonas muca TaxID=2878684 RepID=UPI001E420226|nr:transferase [Luteimonas sp. MHLX1A]MCD9046632.1 transferase [Luteimonas sp. MHLX1A]